MIDEYQKKYKIPSLTTDAVVLRKHKDDDFHDILLVTRGNDPYKGSLAFPGGFVDYGENPVHGCIRELKEETLLDGKDIELLTVRGDPKRDPRRHIVSIFYIVNVDPDAQPKGGDDAKDAKFYDLKDIIENQKDKMAFDHYGVIEELVQKKFNGLYTLKTKDNIKLKSASNSPSFVFDKRINLYLKTIKGIKFDDFKEIKNREELNELIKKKDEFEKLRKVIEKLYEEKLDIIREEASQINSKKWKLFEEKVNKIRELKAEKEKIEKKIEEIKKQFQEKEGKLKSNPAYSINSGKNNFPYSHKALNENYKNQVIYKEKLKAANSKKNITICTGNENDKINDNEIKENNSNTVSVFKKVKEVLDTTIENVKEVAIETITKKNDEDKKKEQIDKIRKITNDAIDEINKLTKFVVEQSNVLIEKISGNSFNNFEKIIFKEISKGDEKCIKCQNCGIEIHVNNIGKLKNINPMNKNNEDINMGNENQWVWGAYKGK